MVKYNEDNYFLSSTRYSTDAFFRHQLKEDFAQADLEQWVFVERDFAWASRFRRLVKDYERLPDTLAGLHFVAFACLFLQQATGILGMGP
jgi:hypothetical protein